MNQTFIFEEFEEECLDYIFEQTKGERFKYPIFPIEGPAFLKMLLSKRQLTALKQKLEKIEVPEDENAVTEIKLDGRTRIKEDNKCKCDIVVLMLKGCQCGNK